MACVEAALQVGEVVAQRDAGAVGGDVEGVHDPGAGAVGVEVALPGQGSGGVPAGLDELGRAGE